MSLYKSSPPPPGWDVGANGFCRYMCLEDDDERPGNVNLYGYIVQQTPGGT
eukprot:gene8866-14448_t